MIFKKGTGVTRRVKRNGDSFQCYEKCNGKDDYVGSLTLFELCQLSKVKKKIGTKKFLAQLMDKKSGELKSYGVLDFENGTDL